jgi:hypothetical protein
MSEAFLVNISSVQDFMQCRYRWVRKWVDNRVPRDSGRALTFGKLLHLVFEEHLANGMPMEQAIDVHSSAYREAVTALADDDPERRTALEAVDDLAAYREPLSMWQDHYPVMPAFEVEQAFEVPHPLDPSIILRGRPDRVAPMWGKLFHVQNRSLGQGVNFGLYCELAKRHLHEHVYAYALQQKYPSIPYGGTLMNLLRKLKYRGVPTKKDPEGKVLHGVNELLWQGIVEINPARTTEMLRNVLYWATEMRKTEHDYRAHGVIPPPNEKLNGGPFGNSMDPYFRVLEGEIALDDDAYFKNREDMYAPLAEAA